MARVRWTEMNNSNRAASTTQTPGRSIANIALPVSIEFVLILVLNFANQIVVATLGDTAVAAVGFANSINLIFNMTLSAIGASVAILVARAFGAKREDQLNNVVSVALLTGTIIAAVFALPLVVWPSEALNLTGATSTVVAAGATYLAISMATVPLNVLSATFSGVLRSANHARSPMVATIATVAVNVPLSIALVFGWGPLPALGVAGAAWAGLITALAKAGVLWWQTFSHFHVARWELPASLQVWKDVTVPLYVLAAPIGVQTLFWTTGNFLYNVVISQLGDDALAATNLLGALEGVFIVASLGLLSATTALVGRAVGAGEGALAEQWVRTIRRVGFWSGIAFGVLFALTALIVRPVFPTVTDTVVAYTIVGVLANAIFQPIKVQNAIHGGGILPSGGDVRGVMIVDFISPFLVGLPLALVLGVWLPYGFVGVVLARLVEEIAKYLLFRWRARRLNWIALAKTPTIEMSIIPDEDDPRNALGQA